MYFSSNEVDDLWHDSVELFDELWNGEPIRLLGVRTTKLEHMDEPQQMNIFEFQKQLESNERSRKLEDAMRQINDKYGKDTIRRGSK